MPVPFTTALPALLLLPAFAGPGTVVSADFDPATAFVPPVATSHAPDVVPYGSHIRVTEARDAGGTTVVVELTGVAPATELAAHVHTGRCAADPAASGPHYQDTSDPVQPSTDPAYANDRNEVRLALRTGAHGDAAARTRVGWRFRPGGARSLVLHTVHAEGARAAGARVACVNVDF
ncbi:Cu-Zn family superoxide dismutase [Streptomyces sp. TLI_235]|nr:superoxide dismutase [Streptomyces sp. TLI_235]PBC79815.1 Cu-Zn family superoxide dismutase [Streptomyces sp. TLI_235]